MSCLKNIAIACAMVLILLAGCQTSDDTPESINQQEETNIQDPQIDPTDTIDTQEKPDGPWHVVSQMQFEYRNNLVAFMNHEFGIRGNTGGRDRKIYYTSNGGQSWAGSENNPGWPTAVDIVSAQSIWKCGHSKFNLSKDGGQTWQILTNPIEECRLLDFLNDQHGWAMSTSKLVVTKDGGNNWEEIIIPEAIGKIAAISLQTSQEGYLLDFDRNLYHTIDGGQSWSAQTLEMTDSDLDMMDLNYPSAAIRFMDDENGVVVMNLAGGGKSELLALHTADGGQTWEHHVLPVGLGVLYLSHDGQYITVTEPGSQGKVTLLANQAVAESRN
jgi:photosystem II stability/assembly factor-like uncharacterized protein